jgi:hypothetical protein
MDPLGLTNQGNYYNVAGGEVRWIVRSLLGALRLLSFHPWNERF